MTRGNVTTSQTRGTSRAVGDKSSSSCSNATINKKKWDKDALVVSLGGGDATAHLATSALQL